MGAANLIPVACRPPHHAGRACPGSFLTLQGDPAQMDVAISVQEFAYAAPAYLTIHELGCAANRPVPVAPKYPRPFGRGCDQSCKPSDSACFAASIFSSRTHSASFLGRLRFLRGLVMLQCRIPSSTCRGSVPGRFDGLHCSAVSGVFESCKWPFLMSRRNEARGRALNEGQGPVPCASS